MADTKVCSICKEALPRDRFYGNKRRADGLQTACKSCKSLVSKEWYQNNKKLVRARAREAQRRQRRRHRQRMSEYLQGKACVDCGEAEPCVLDFDHVRGKKAFGIARGKDRSWEVVLVELAKCEIRCANCHRKRTAKILGWYNQPVEQ